MNLYLIGWRYRSKDPYHDVGQAHGASILMADTQTCLLIFIPRPVILRPPSDENTPFFEEYLQATCIGHTGL